MFMLSLSWWIMKNIQLCECREDGRRIFSLCTVTLGRLSTTVHNVLTQHGVFNFYSYRLKLTSLKI